MEQRDEHKAEQYRERNEGKGDERTVQEAQVQLSPTVIYIAG